MREIDQAEFKEATKEGFIIVDVFGDNCSPCEVLAQRLTVMEEEYSFLNFLKINAHKNRDFAKEYKISGVPTLLFMVDGEEKERAVGALTDQEILDIAGPYLY